MGSTSSPSSSNGSSHEQNVVLFPFMSKGHTIPLLQFARILLRRRHVAVTVITTPANRPFVADSLEGTAATIITIPFSNTIAGGGIESTDKLPSISLFHEFALSTASMQSHFEQAIEAMPRVSFMVTDGFLWWTLESATKFGIPRLVYFGMSCYSHSLMMQAFISGILTGPQPDDELVELTQFPWIKLSKDDFEVDFRNGQKPGNLGNEFLMKSKTATVNSYGLVVNSFYDLEAVFIEYLNSNSTSANYKYWCVGPFCLPLQQPHKIYAHPGSKPAWIGWLDEKMEEKRCVLYVAFGSQAEVSREQLEEIANGLEESMVSFLWVIRKDWSLPDGFEERLMKKRSAMVVREWVDQREILMHESIDGFLSHCGWNSVLESICNEVPILAWPMMAEQHLNARMVEEEIKVGLRVETCDGSLRGFVTREGLRKSVKELMEGDKGREAKKNVSELARMARVAMEEGGSSWSTLESLLYETSFQNKEKNSSMHQTGQKQE